MYTIALGNHIILLRKFGYISVFNDTEGYVIMLKSQYLDALYEIRDTLFTNEIVQDIESIITGVHGDPPTPGEKQKLAATIRRSERGWAKIEGKNSDLTKVFNSLNLDNTYSDQNCTAINNDLYNNNSLTIIIIHSPIMGLLRFHRELLAAIRLAENHLTPVGEGHYTVKDIRFKVTSPSSLSVKEMGEFMQILEDVSVLAGHQKVKILAIETGSWEIILQYGEAVSVAAIALTAIARFIEKAYKAVVTVVKDYTDIQNKFADTDVKKAEKDNKDADTAVKKSDKVLREIEIAIKRRELDELEVAAQAKLVKELWPTLTPEQQDRVRKADPQGKIAPRLLTDGKSNKTVLPAKGKSKAEKQPKKKSNPKSPDQPASSPE